MKVLRPGRRTIFLWNMAALMIFSFASVARAHPYASGITNNAGLLNSGPTNQVTGRGIYILNADTSDALGRGTNASMPAASWGSSTTYAPYKCFVGPDDKLYVGDSSGLNTGATTAGEPVWMI